jgi:hypothetical protein
MGESGWRHNADNPNSSAYGIPQSLPGSKMASEGADWRTNPATQIRWGLKYIKKRPDYGKPSVAYAKWLSRSPHWYKEGGMIDIPSLKSGGVSMYDNVIANLHKDETVLTAPLSKDLRDNIASNPEVNYNVKVVVGNVNNTTVDDIEDAVYRAIEKKEIKLGYGRRIGR